VAGDSATARVHARRTAVDHRPARIDVDHQPLPVDDIRPMRELDIADDRDQFLVEILDSEIALGRLGRAVHHNPAGGIQPADLHAAAILR